MSWLSRFSNVFRRDRVNRDLEDELQFHLKARTEEYTARGMTPQQAGEAARRHLGNQLLLRESSSEVKLLPRLESILQDVGFGLRLLRKNVMATAAAIVSLSLAIGACTSAFSLIDALILRPLPVNDPQRLVYVVFQTPSATAPARDSEYFNYPLFESMRSATNGKMELFGMSAQSRREVFLDDAGGQSEKIFPQWVSGNTFSTLGVKAALGRLLTSADDQKPGQHPVAVLSHDFWSRRFGGSPAVLGRWLTLQGKQFQIIGVTEKGFTGGEPGTMTDVWVPNMMWDAGAIADSGWNWFRIWGRLQPGVTSDQARAVLQTVFTNFRRQGSAAFRADEPRDRVNGFINTPLYLRSAASGPSRLRDRFERPLWVLGLVAMLVLLIACSNVASLLIARAVARDREMALRISIGAGRGRLIQQVLIESALLSVASCALGILLAAVAAPLIVGMMSTSSSQVRLDLYIDWRVLAFLGTAGSLTAFLFGLAPALRASAVSPNEALKSGSSKHTAGIGLFRPLVGAQTAFSFMVLFVAGLFLASFAKLTQIDPGFDRNQLSVVELEATALRRQGSKAHAVWTQMLERLREAQGIESASLSGWSLFTGSSQTSNVRIPGKEVDTRDAYFLPVSPRFLETMRIRLIDGRDFERRDGQLELPSAVIVNESFARQYFPNESVVGKRFFRLLGRGERLLTLDIIGIVRDAKYNSLRGETPPTAYYPLQPEHGAVLQVRTSLKPVALAALLREELPRVHPAFRITGITPQSTLIEDSVVQERLLALLSGFFSIVAMVLAAVGLYGVLSYSVVTRTREIGIRVALGAHPMGVVGMVVAEVGIVVFLGIGSGLAGAIFVSQFVTKLLYAVRPADLPSIAGPLVCLLVACALSASVPAWRATRIDPMKALRYE